MKKFAVIGKQLYHLTAFFLQSKIQNLKLLDAQCSVCCADFCGTNFFASPKQPHWCTGKAEVFAKLAFHVAAVIFGEAFGIVDKERNWRWLRSHLSTVIEFALFSLAG